MAGQEPEAEVQILLVTSRQTRRWIIPKGHVDFHMSPHQAAAQEAFEEAGVVGEIGHKPLGVFRYEKLLARGATVNAKVAVFPLAVSQELEDWQEKNLRERRWFPQSEASEAVQEPELAEIIRRFGTAR
jgi:uncharacterized protein